MAVTLATQTLLDGSRNTIIKVSILGDGVTEMNKTIIYDASAYIANDTNNSLMRITYSLRGFSGTLFWDASTDVQLLDLVENYDTDQKFRYTGGIINNAGAGKTGDILMTSYGLGSAANLTGEIILYIKQR